MVQIPVYIDPGTGSLIWQSLAAVFIGAMFYARRIVAKIKSWMGASSVKSGSELGKD